LHLITIKFGQHKITNSVVLNYKIDCMIISEGRSYAYVVSNIADFSASHLAVPIYSDGTFVLSGASGHVSEEYNGG